MVDERTGQLTLRALVHAKAGELIVQSTGLTPEDEDEDEDENERQALNPPPAPLRIPAMEDAERQELAKLRAEVKRLRRQVEELGASSNKFLGVATHDLRVPLSSLRLIGEMLSQPGRVSLDTRPLVDTMMRNVDAMEALVTNVLNASRLSHPATRLNLEEFALNPAVEDIIAGLFPQAIRRDVTIDAHLSPSVGIVLADRARVGQMVTNLLGNALKFTPPGGTVVVASDGGDDWVELSVSDTGPGLTEEDKEKVFSSFFKGSAESAHGDPCTGLGLYITKQIAEAHGGTVGAEGAPGKGSLFFFKIPRRAENDTVGAGNREEP
jgi:signal transduction histidine kinase